MYFDFFKDGDHFRLNVGWFELIRNGSSGHSLEFYGSRMPYKMRRRTRYLNASLGYSRSGRVWFWWSRRNHTYRVIGYGKVKKLFARILIDRRIQPHIK
jgi:hypothetical protein